MSSVRKPLVAAKEQKSEETARTMTSLPPEWIDTYEDCKVLLREIDDVSKFAIIKERR
jgi:hypothetical protein